MAVVQADLLKDGEKSERCKGERPIFLFFSVLSPSSVHTDEAG